MMHQMSVEGADTVHGFLGGDSCICQLLYIFSNTYGYCHHAEVCAAVCLSVYL